MSDVDGRWWDREPKGYRPLRDVPGSIDSGLFALVALRAKARPPKRPSVWMHLLGLITWPIWRKW